MNGESDNKLLSVIIPAYNVSAYIDQGLQSLVQNREILPYLDILVINDGSTDNTLGIVRKYCDEYESIISVIDKENGGHGSGINVGIANAKGRYIKVMDGDDWAEEEGLRELVRYILDGSEQPDLIINPFAKRWENGESKIIEYPGIQAGETVTYREVNLNNYTLPLHALTIHRKLYEENSIPPIDEKISYDDMEYILFPVPFVNSIVFLEHVFYNYRLGLPTQSMNSAQMMKKVGMHTKVINRLHDYYIENKEIFNEEQRKYYLHELIDTIATNYVIQVRSGVPKKETRRLMMKYSDLPLNTTRNRKFRAAQINETVGRFLIKLIAK